MLYVFVYLAHIGQDVADAVLTEENEIVSAFEYDLLGLAISWLVAEDHLVAGDNLSSQLVNARIHIATFRNRN